MNQRIGFRVGAAVVIALAVGALAFGVGGKEARDAAVRAEARRLVGGLGRLWPGWKAPPEPAPGGGAPGSPLLAAQARAGGTQRVEAEIGLAVAGAFHAWAGRALPPGPEFEDAGPTAPEGWARKALVELKAKEAQLLAETLDAPKAKQARVKVAAWTRVRFRRAAILRAGSLARLRANEREQGLALYTAYQALLYGRHPGYEPGPEITAALPGFGYTLAPHLREAALAALGRAARGDPAGYTPEVSGFAMALALDRVRHGWREELLEGKKSLDELLVAQVRPYGRERLKER